MAGLDASLSVLETDGHGGVLLPLHRAVSGFHFHGNQRLVLKTLSVLID
eukprot:CAMPEP_0185787238 /NCGR_PEP_ID=MMETSP1174-20130828/139480_1 /TAXON_ID=35687 /ORGANISM="Dictyocha speculum, Strain CCMP1381" /LENGTH=48 /DNA_ID= /DNA_START= /DNA_END= /DNA_ORIENTATION=